MKRTKGIKFIGLSVLISSCLLGCTNDKLSTDRIELVTPISTVDNTSIKTIATNIDDNNTKSDECIEKENILNIVDSEKDDLIKLVNKENSLKSSYNPTDLTKANIKSTKNNILVREVCINPLEKMFLDASQQGVELSLVSGFRSYNYQLNIYNNSLRVKGQEYTNKYIAKQGHSEHQTGLAVDISSASNNFELNENFKNTIEGQWLQENAHKYGFILRYKMDRVDDTGYGFEPWHFRYVGIEVATYIYENNLILEDLFLQKT